MSGKKRADPPLVAWDSCVFLAWYNNEEEKNLGDIEHLLREVRNDKFVMLVSAVVCAEVMDQAGRSDAGTLFRKFVKRTSILQANVDWRVAEKAVVFREKVCDLLKSRTLDKGLKAPDALIAATAAVYRADVLHSYDPTLLALSECDELDGLVVTKPCPLDGSTRLFQTVIDPNSGS